MLTRRRKRKRAPIRRRAPVRRRRRRRPRVRRRFRRKRVGRQTYNPFSELKFKDGFQGGVTSTTGTIIPTINGVPRGTGRSERIGRKIIIKHVSIRYTVNIPPIATSSNSSDVIRFVMYQDKQTNGLAAAITDILDTTLLSLTYQSFLNLVNAGRFKILFDHKFVVNALSGTTGFNFDSRVYNAFYTKELNIPVDFDDTVSDGDISSMRTNNIGYFFISRQGDALWNAVTRVRYQG